MISDIVMHSVYYLGFKRKAKYVAISDVFSEWKLGSVLLVESSLLHFKWIFLIYVVIRHM